MLSAKVSALGFRAAPLPEGPGSPPWGGSRVWTAKHCKVAAPYAVITALPVDYSAIRTMKGAARRDRFHELRISVSWTDPERWRRFPGDWGACPVEGD